MQNFDHLSHEEQVLDLCRRLRSVCKFMEENVVEIVENGNPGQQDLNKSVENGMWHIEQLLTRLRRLTRNVIDL